MSDTLFQKIINGELDATIIHDDDHCIAIEDIQPQAPTHVLIIPKKPLRTLSAATINDQTLLGHLLLVASQLAEQLRISDGYRVIINNGALAGQSVFHLHVHLLGGRVMQWPPG